MTEDRFNTNEPTDFSEPESQNPQKGKLKIFLGIMPGCGKAMAMLRAAQVEASNGRHVAVGIITWQTRPDTMSLMGDLKVVPPKDVSYSGAMYKEMDTRAILDLHPDLVVMTSPAHLNAPGSRHLKRYHDIEEILDHGIDVYTTLNVVQLESYAGFLQETMGHVIPTVPDEFLAGADDVELVDIEPARLVKRYREGKVFIGGFPDKVVENLYQTDKIEAIRKRFFQMTLDRENWQKQHFYWPNPIRARLLTVLQPDKITPYVIRRAKAMATLIGTDWISLYIEPSRDLNREEKLMLEDNIRLARQLGSTFITYKGDDPVEAILEVSRRERVSHLILAKTRRGKIAGYPRNFLKRILKESGHINISIICGETLSHYEQKKKFITESAIPRLGVGSIMLLAALIIGILCTVLDNKTATESWPYITILLFVVLGAFVRVGSAFLAVVLVLMAAIIFLMPPALTFPFGFSEDWHSLLLFCAITIICGYLILKFRVNRYEAFIREKQSNALFLLTKRLADATGVKEVIDTSTENLLKYFNVKVYFIIRDQDHRLTNYKYCPNGWILSDSEMETAYWAYKHDRPAGRFTDVMSAGKYTYYPLTGKGVKIGVLAAKLEKPFSGENDISWDAFLTQIVQAIEHRYLEMAAHRTNLLNESDKLYKTLFNSISHELRIPISTIMGASDLLLAAPHPEHIRTELYDEILGASRRLNRLVENLLNMSRLESGRIAANPDWCDVHDLFNRIAKNLKEDLRPFRFNMSVPETMPLVRIDYGLMEQAIYNLVYNATLYALPGTSIRLSACYDNGFFVVQVTDRGPGFEPEMINRVFNKFWRPENGKTGGLGLGLSIVKGFVEAHNGTVFVTNRKGGGARFTIMILTERSGYYSNKNTINDKEE